MTTFSRGTGIFLLLLSSALSSKAGDLPRSSPEAQGIPSAGLLRLVEALDGEIDAMHSLMILRHGQVIAEGWWAPYTASSPHVLYSLSKSFTSTAVGLAIAEGKLDLSDPVASFFPDALPPGTSGNLQAMRIRDLLTMSTGHQDEPPTSPAEMSAASFLTHPVPHKPGTHFRYNTAATFMLSAIVQKVSGETVLDYLQPRLFDPLGIGAPVWDTNFEGISLGGYGLRIRTEDIAKFGQLYLQNGRWGDRQLLPAKWVEQAGSRQMSNGSNPQSDWEQGYGFQFWRCRHNAFRGDGAFGQYCVVMPEQDMVVAITSGTRNMPAILELLWKHLLPTVGDEAVAMAASPDAEMTLRKKLTTLEIRTAAGGPTPSDARLNRRFVFDKNAQGIEALELVSADAGKTIELAIRREGREDRIPCGHQKWASGRAPFPGGRLAQFQDEAIAGSFGWPAEGTCIIKLCAYETPFALTMRLEFGGNEVTLKSEANVAFEATTRPGLQGRAE